MNIKEEEIERGIVLGCILLLPIVVPQFFSFNIETNSNLFKIINAAYILYIGLLFLLSYYYSHKTFALRWFHWICMYISWPRSRKMAFFYFGLALFLSSLAVLDAFGFIS